MKSIYSLVGMKYQGTVALVASLPKGEPVTLVREPTNRFDADAVQVYARERMIGYLASSENQDIARQMDAAASGLAMTFDCRFVPGPQPQIEVDVTKGGK